MEAWLFTGNIPSSESQSVFGEGSFLEDVMIFFTADTHFGHANIIKYCDRPFEDVGEMDEELIKRWNQVVGKKDSVYHLGDFCWGEPKKYMDRLNGNLFLLRGSHDRNSLKYCHKDSILRVNFCNDEYGNPRYIVMCHYAMRSWDHSHFASWHLFGHHHGALPPHGLSFDVGVDCWNFHPVSLFKVQQKMATLQPIVDYRKKKDLP